MNTDWPEELLPTAEKINELLDRLEQHFMRERRFTSSAAHELRTPISELQLATDVALRARENPQRLLTAVQQANTIAEKMAELVRSLSLLTRQQRDEYSIKKETANLCELIRDEALLSQPIAEERSVAVNLQLPESQFIYADTSLLKCVISNLINNAFSYAPSDTEVLIQLVVSGPRQDSLALKVRNICPQILEQELDYLFEPFWRKENVYGTQHHFGLGLAITREASQLLGYELGVSKPAADIIEFTLTAKLEA
ncbi:sensor histidine kinase [Hahella ganghwensis]|uniref:sensor histidine kinase n=1 Tax=Hahella ganghwensis TaxID=286420 RepID=UPI00037972BF|nr:HAMP domain-containing sensor histidine kinase [Hahella ganghwensis]